ncbi:MAG: zinc-binding dehydrogenase [Bryobacteraceae bacterium]
MTDRTCSAAVLARYKKPLEMRKYPVSAAGPGEVLARVEMAGICGTDVHLWDGELNIPLPVVLGHETVGRIEELGDGAEKDWRGEGLAPGDRITWASSIVCGECYYCRLKRQPTRCLHRKAYGISYCANESPHLRGGYAEYILLRAGTAVIRIPDSVPTESVVGAGCALTTVLHGVEHTPIELGDVVVIQGAGPVGLAAVAVAIQSGASKVIVIGAPRERLALAREFGAHAVVSILDVPHIEERRHLVLKETGPHGADVVLECVGRPEAVPEGWDLCRDGGKCLVLGQYANSGTVTFSPHIITRKQLQISGSWGFEPRHVDLAVRLLEDQRWQASFAREVTHRFQLAQANSALETARSQTAGKVVILP